MAPLSDPHHSPSPFSPQWEEIESFLAGQASPEDGARIETWLETSPEARTLLAEHRQAITDMLPRPSAEEAMATLRSVQRHIAASSARTSSPAPALRQKGRAGSRQWWGVAGLLGCVAIVMMLAKTPIETFMSRDTVAANTMRAIMTAPGQHARFHLPDGTSVMLAPGSALRYDKTFGSAQRQVYLDGEALFTVTHRAGTPFTVQVADRLVQVLGTTFTVRHYADDTATRVVVAEGRVMAENTVLGIGDAATIDGSRQTTVEHGIDIASALAWTSGRLVFDRSPLSDVLPELSRWYGVTIFATDKALLRKRVTTTLDSKNRQEGLDILAALVRADMVRTANGIELQPK